MTRAEHTSPPFSASAFRIDQGSQIIEPVCGDKSAGQQLPQAIFHFGGKPMRLLRQFEEETGSLLFQNMQNILRGVRKSGGVRRTIGNKPAGVLAQEQSNRRYTRWAYATVLGDCRM